MPGLNGRWFKPDEVLLAFKTKAAWDQEYPMLFRKRKRHSHLTLDGLICGWVCDSAAPPGVYARIWRQYDGELYGVVSTHKWDLVTSAACFSRHKCQDVPNESDACGIYGVTKPDELVTYTSGTLSRPNADRGYRYVVGLIEVWGKVIKAECGARAEYARPLVLIGKNIELAPKWHEVPSLEVDQALGAIQRGSSLQELL